ncbi:Ig-like domain-containing protein [Aureisphaera galaxeae]|uniref:Ig-like domain-containing protein n=1 Tax=Aureisphaera galaxeae TaxID=1538023 RepID=UPI0023505D4B|nr:Ig-like domain-containing protein [Aureisphaera galaxeae]MDC8003316.1 Ig-like domain-containing protein [Aureisphaera galaxeae]
MKPSRLIILFMFPVIISGCIGNDFLNDRVEERIVINNLIREIQINNTYELMATFFNFIGESTEVTFSWESSDPTVLSIDNEGVITALEVGAATITVSTSLEDGTLVTEEITIDVITEEANNDGPIVKSGVIVTTSSYTLTGDFTLSEIEDSPNLDLQIAENYVASDNLPGLYLYLSNNPNSVDVALEIGPVSVFEGEHSYLIENIGINDYQYLLYWCEPFAVKVGHGEIEN